MAAIHDLLAQVTDEDLRKRLEVEIDKLSKNKKFGLVFEEHIPECTALYDVAIKRGMTVARKDGPISEQYTVLSLRNGTAACVRRAEAGVSDSAVAEKFPVDELVAVAQFGEPIYPYLKPMGSVCNAPDSDLWHTLIEADNYHALQLLEYLYAGKVDCIYIDPPYNTGAKDWKYNNDYVDGNDVYRHSKWLSMMKKRLLLAKRLLNPKDSVLIVTIDDVEVHTLSLLLQEIFKDSFTQVIASVVNPSGKVGNGFSVVQEYISFTFIGGSKVQNTDFDMLFPNEERNNSSTLAWESLLRRGANWTPMSRPNLFYPILIDQDTKKIIRAGSPMPPSDNLPKSIDGYFAAWPIKKDGSYAIWRVDGEKLCALAEKGYAYITQYDKNRETYSFKYLMKGDIERIERGEISVERIGDNGEVVAITSYRRMKTPKTVWNVNSHNAGMYGSDLLSNVIGRRGFSYPKALYAVCDCLRFFVANKPNALIIDFFAGSGTTLHAVNLLNAEDGGQRRCIMVTNNEVSETEAKTLTKQGYRPGDEEWEKLGIARYVTWPRTVCSIEGHDVNGEPLKGNYIGSDIPMSDGFAANAAYFKLGFLDKNMVSLGRQFKELLPILWLKTGAHGVCPALEAKNLPDMLILPENHFAVLLQERSFENFRAKVNELPEITTIFFVTDYETSYRAMSQSVKAETTYQLYRDYLDNFRINFGRD
ncbi:MAG: site-specific DNA-methyltransferase [Pyramidobacter sp.]|nr:site-specific DNA-methyltransferase [Pyramidobacter sp.]